MSRIVAILLAAVLSTGLTAQQQAPAFDVASIKPNVSTATAAFQLTPNGRFTATNTSLRALILRAYGLHDSQLIGAPDWIAAERFDVDARVDPAPAGGPNALLPLVRTLLIERFRLKTHDEMRELPAYVLTFARDDRRLGSQIRPTQADCSGKSHPTQAEIRAQARDGWAPCGMSFMTTFVDSSDVALKVRIRRSAVTMGQFATALQANVDRPVVDRTGLEGVFDIEYSFAQQPAANAPGGQDNNQPLLLVALEEQLGLKLESRRTAVPVVVIDLVERPAPD
jgi:uncharacterized protein (TIGR03435 family)